MTGDALPPIPPVPITQVAIVVQDIRAAMDASRRALGWGPWNVCEHRPPLLHDTRLRGEPTAYTMVGAETRVGPLVVELIEPGEGPSIYKEWLERHGEGLHHVACMAHSAAGADALKARFAALGAGELMGGRIGESIEFHYLDTEPLLHATVESGAGCGRGGGAAILREPARVVPARARNARPAAGPAGADRE